MSRCLQLANLAIGNVSPNPMVGAVLVAGGKIIAEGWHKVYGGQHAEVECFQSIAEGDRKLIAGSTLYVSLEPCSHFGKTPPCTDLLIREGIRKVVVGCTDPFPSVNGKGVEKLRTAGIEVKVGVMEKECIDLNRAFFHFHTKHRPFIVLKWAESADKMISKRAERVLISHPLTNQLVHKWRSEVMGIMVGSTTVVTDDPALTTRHWPGKDPVRLVVDPRGRVSGNYHVLDLSTNTMVFTDTPKEDDSNLSYMPLQKDQDLITQLMEKLYEKNIQSILVEGGAKLLQSFIDAGMWDEARVITNRSLLIGDGVRAPILSNSKPVHVDHVRTDEIAYYENTNTK